MAVSQATMMAQDGWARLSRSRAGAWLARAGAVLFVVALPVALVGTTVRVFFTTAPIYTYAVESYRVPEVTGIPKAEIDRAMAEIRDYFTNDQRLLRITVTDDADRIGPLFTPREVIHMLDVKVLVRRIFTAQVIAGLYALGYLLARVLVQRRAAWLGLARLTKRSMLGTLVVALAFTFSVFTGFDQLFIRFHLVFFPNGLWQLDPAQDRLIQMFPDGFWHVSTVLLAGAVLIEVLLLLSVASVYVQRQAYIAPPVRPATGAPRAQRAEKR